MMPRVPPSSPTRHAPASAAATQALPLVPQAIAGGMVTLPGPRYCAVVEVGAVDLGLLSEDEATALAGAYHGFLAGLSFPIQLLVRVQPEECTSYTRWYRSRAAQDAAQELALRALVRAHLAHAESLCATAVPLAYRYYVVVPAPEDLHAGGAARDPGRPAHGLGERFARLRRLLGPAPGAPASGGAEAAAAGRSSGAAVAAALDECCAHVMAGLRAVGLPVQRLDTRALAELWYACLSPQNAAVQPLAPAALLDPLLPVATIAEHRPGRPPLTSSAIQTRRPPA